MPVWGLFQPFKAFAKGTVPAGSITISPTQARAAKHVFAATTPLAKVGQF